MRSQIFIPGSYGAEVFAGEIDDVVIRGQSTEGEGIVGLTTSEARQVAAALLEVADYCDSQNAKGA